VQVQQALRLGATAEEVFEQTKIDPWFIDQIVLINEIADWIASLEVLDAASLRKAKKHGFSDSQLAQLRGVSEEEIREGAMQRALGRYSRRLTPVRGSFQHSRHTTTAATTRSPRSFHRTGKRW